MENEKIQTLSEIADELFDQAGVGDDDELTFESSKKVKFEDDSEGDEAAKEGRGEQDEESKDERLYAGRYKTPEEMEAALLKMEQEKAQPQPPVDTKQEQQPSDGIPDLTKEELIVLHERDDQDGSQYTVEYLQKKMSERDLTKFELEKLREIDDDSMDLYSKYIEVKTERNVLSRIDPVLKPVKEEQSKKEYEAFIEREKAIEESNTKEFGSELPQLKQRVSDPKFIESVLSQSVSAPVIIDLWNRGEKALSHKLLLRETKAYLDQTQETQKVEKRKKSVPADIGKGSSFNKSDVKAKSIEDAFDIACDEHNF